MSMSFEKASGAAAAASPTSSVTILFRSFLASVNFFVQKKSLSAGSACAHVCGRQIDFSFHILLVFARC